MKLCGIFRRRRRQQFETLDRMQPTNNRFVCASGENGIFVQKSINCLPGIFSSSSSLSSFKLVIIIVRTEQMHLVDAANELYAVVACAHVCTSHCRLHEYWKVKVFSDTSTHSIAEPYIRIQKYDSLKCSDYSVCYIFANNSAQEHRV